MATFIATTPREKLHILAWQGFLVPECHAQLEALIASKFGHTHARLLAIPAFDPDGGIVDWHTSAEGPVTPLTALPVPEQEALLQQFCTLGQDLRGLAEELQMQREQKALAGHILELALIYPDLHCLYRVGDQPVYTCWGFESAAEGAPHEDISRARPVPPHGAAVPPASPPVAAVPVNRAGWLLSLLPLLLFLLLAAAMLTSCDGRPPMLTVPGMQFPALRLSTPDWLKPAPLPELDVQRRRQLELIASIETLRAKADLCSRTASPRPAPKPEAQKLTIPEQASTTGDMAFLAGIWECETGLRDRTTNQAVNVFYSFDEHGQGYVAINSTKGLCQSTVKATFDDKRQLTFTTSETIPCPQGPAFSGQTVTCEDKNGEALCTGVNQSADAATWSAVFKRKD